jgi:ubiquinone/menaquinone biosynthesis C-methylase UbiE
MATDKDWDKHWGKKRTRTTINKERMMKILDKHSKGKVLDAGCGTGFFSRYFLNKGCNVFALDYSNRALIITKKINERINSIKGDVTRIPLKNEKFDIIFTDGLLEHFKEPDGILKNFKRILKNKGIVATFVPNKFSYWMFLKPFIMSHINENRFTIKGLEEMHKKNGFNIIESGGFTVLPSSLSPEFLGKYIGRILYVIAKK